MMQCITHTHVLHDVAGPISACVGGRWAPRKPPEETKGPGGGPGQVLFAPIDAFNVIFTYLTVEENLVLPETCDSK